MRIARRWCLIGTLFVALGGVPSAMAGPEPAEPPAEKSQGRAWLGVWLADAVDGGVEVVAVAPGGPAQQAGLLGGDILLEADGEPVQGEDAVGRMLLKRRPGDPLELIVLRGGQSVRARVELGRRGPAAPRLPRVPDPPRARWHAYSSYERARTGQATPLGLQVVVVTPALRAHFGAPEKTGVLVTRVEPDEPAARAGIRVGDLLLSIGETEITDPRRLRDLLLTWNRVEPLRATIVRGQEPQVVRIESQQAAQMSAAATASAAWLEALQQAHAEQRERERAVLERRMVLEIERLERRIEELRQELEELSGER